MGASIQIEVLKVYFPIAFVKNRSITKYKSRVYQPFYKQVRSTYSALV